MKRLSFFRSNNQYLLLSILCIATLFGNNGSFLVIPLMGVFLLGIIPLTITVIKKKSVNMMIDLLIGVVTIFLSAAIFLWLSFESLFFDSLSRNLAFFCSLICMFCIFTDNVTNRKSEGIYAILPLSGTIILLIIFLLSILETQEGLVDAMLAPHLSPKVSARPFQRIICNMREWQPLMFLLAGLLIALYYYQYPKTMSISYKSTYKFTSVIWFIFGIINALSVIGSLNFGVWTNNGGYLTSLCWIGLAYANYRMSKMPL